MLAIGCNDKKVGVNQSTECLIYALSTDLSEDEVTPLAKKNFLKNDFTPILKEWLLNGASASSMGLYGQVTPVTREFEAVCEYKAPPKVPKGKANVNLTAVLKDLLYKDPITKKIFKDLSLQTQIEIVGELKFELRINYLAKDVVSDVLVDSARMDLTLNDGIATFSNFQNYAGNILPQSKTYSSGCTVTWLVEGFPGPLHITAATALYASPSNELTIFFSGIEYLPGSTASCPKIPDLISPAQSTPLSWPLPLKFNLNEEIAIYQDPVLRATLIRLSAFGDDVLAM
ncbi:MAG: hypothetical protein ABIS36_10335 [Chryseolinea sp.]